MSLIYSITCLVEANLRQSRRDGKEKSNRPLLARAQWSLLLHRNKKTLHPLACFLSRYQTQPVLLSGCVDVPPLICTLLFPLSRAFNGLTQRSSASPFVFSFSSSSLLHPTLLPLSFSSTTLLRLTGGLAAVREGCG